jgi:hypothetical protein
MQDVIYHFSAAEISSHFVQPGAITPLVMLVRDDIQVFFTSGAQLGQRISQKCLHLILAFP